MKQSIGIILTTLYLVALIQPIQPILQYSLNKTDYILNYCQDKIHSSLFCNEDCEETQHNHCDGKCHLKVQLSKNSKSNNTPLLQDIDLSKFPFAWLYYNSFIVKRSEQLIHQGYYLNGFNQYIFNIDPFPPKV